MSDHDLDIILRGTGGTPDAGFSCRVMARIAELDALRDEYRRQDRALGSIARAATAVGLAASMGVAVALMPPVAWLTQVGEVVGFAVAATDMRQWAAPVLLATAAALAAASAANWRVLLRWPSTSGA